MTTLGMKTLRQRLLPAPLLSLALAIVWPVLNQSWSSGQMLLGVLLAIAVPWFTEPLSADKPRLRRPGVALRLGLTVLKDIVTSNIDVARLILGTEAAIRPGFVWLPLRLSDPHGIVALAGIITMTPGTLSAEITPDRRHLLIHAFNVDDEASLIATIQSRYEAPLMEIFE
jgi:multicomponent K+:H+ antiporter subunit E